MKSRGVKTKVTNMGDLGKKQSFWQKVEKAFTNLKKLLCYILMKTDFFNTVNQMCYGG